MYSADWIDAAADPAASFARVVRRHRYILGLEVSAFEEAFAEYCGTAECIGVANGTDALELALRALDLTAGARVALVANAGNYGSTAVRLVGAEAVYVDVDDATLTMSAAALADAAAAKRIDAVLVTHLYGRLADVEAIGEITARLGIPLIEDSAQAHGAARDGRRAGSYGTVGCFSFYPTKNLPAVGDAGALVTNDRQLATRVRRLRQYGWSDKYTVDTPNGRNSRMDEVQAAVLNDRLPLLDELNEARKAIADNYSRVLAGSGLRLPETGDDFVAHLYVVRTSARERLREHLRERDIGSEVHYPVPDHLQPAYAGASDRRGLPVTERACSEVLSLPCFPGMTPAQIERVAAVVGSFEPAVAVG